MEFLRSKTASVRSWKLVLALLCVGLMLLGSTLQVAHAHLDNASHADCSLCATAHVGIASVALPVFFTAASFVLLPDAPSPLTRSTDLFRYALFTRPPPADAASA